MGTRTKESRRRIHSLILLIAFTAILLIVSTYAWFTTQKDVTVSNLKGTIEVAESLEISLDGKTWSHKIDVDNGVLKDATKVANVNRNILPTEILPVSATGLGASALMPMHKISYNGGLITEISDVTESLADASSNETSSREGYFAFDIYLKNLSKDYDDLGNEVVKDVLKLNSNSYAWVLGKQGVDTNGDGTVDAINDVTVNKTINTIVNGTPVVYDKIYKGDDTKGLQNTLRIAFARYGDGSTDTAGGQGYIESGASQSVIVANNKPGTSDPMTISSLSIWEPNADLHTESVFNSVTVKQSATVTDLFTPTGSANGTKSSSITLGTATFMKDTNPFNTFAIKHDEAGTASTTNPVNPNDWTLADYFGEQKTVQTSTYYDAGHDARVKRYIDGGVKTLKDTSNNEFTLAANSVTKVRVYVWMEGQDPDCTNDNTHGGGIELQIGLVKSINDGNTDKRTDEINALPTIP